VLVIFCGVQIKVSNKGRGYERIFAMIENGFFTVHRAVWNHDLFKDDKQAFSRREAWIWLISEAAWKPTRRRVKNRPYELERGQLVASFRGLAKLWMWSEGKVRRYFDSLIFEAMVEVKSDECATHITICKYNEYQVQRRTDECTDGATFERTPDALPTHSPPQPIAATTEKAAEQVEQINKKQEKKDSQSVVVKFPRSTDADWEKFRAEYPKRGGSNPWQPARKKFDALIKSGENPEIIITGATVYRVSMERNCQIGTPYVCQAQTWLNQRRWEDGAQGVSIFDFENRDKTNGRSKPYGRQNVSQIYHDAADALEASESGQMGSGPFRAPDGSGSPESRWGPVITLSECEPAGPTRVWGENGNSATPVSAGRGSALHERVWGSPKD